MKDLIAKLQMDANCALGAIWMHIDAREKRIAELEAQIAAASAPSDTDKVREAVEAMNRAKLLPIWDNDVPHKLHVELDVTFKALSSMAAQAPVREVPEAWISVEDRYPELTVRNENKVVIDGRTIPPTTSSERVLVVLESGARQIDRATRLDGSEHTFFQCYGKRVKYWSPLPAAPVQQEDE